MKPQIETTPKGNIDLFALPLIPQIISAEALKGKSERNGPVPVRPPREGGAGRCV